MFKNKNKLIIISTSILFIFCVVSFIIFLGLGIHKEYLIHTGYYINKDVVANKVGWHKSLPKFLQKQATWKSKKKTLYSYNFKKRSKHKIKKYKIGTYVYYNHFSKNQGYNPTPVSYIHGKSYQGNGSSALLSLKPYFKEIGHNTYQVISGNHTLNEDLTHVIRKNGKNYIANPTSKITIRKINDHKINIWQNWNKHKTQKTTFITKK